MEKIKYAEISEEESREMDARRARTHARAVILAHEAVADLQRRRILDANRERIRKDIPAEMREDSDADMATF